MQSACVKRASCSQMRALLEATNARTKKKQEVMILEPSERQEDHNYDDDQDDMCTLLAHQSFARANGLASN